MFFLMMSEEGNGGGGDDYNNIDILFSASYSVFISHILHQNNFQQYDTHFIAVYTGFQAYH